MGITMRVFLLLAVLASAYAVPTGNPIRVKGEMESTDFEDFKAQFGKAYAFGQEEAHKQSFLKTVEFINKHNAEYDEGKHTYWCGVNEYADLSDEEFNKMNGFNAKGLPITFYETGAYGKPAVSG